MKLRWKAALGLVVILAVFFILFWVLLAIPSCTTYSGGFKHCQNFEGPWDRHVWTEQVE